MTTMNPEATVGRHSECIRRNVGRFCLKRVPVNIRVKTHVFRFRSRVMITYSVETVILMPITLTRNVVREVYHQLFKLSHTTQRHGRARDG